jgi:hypothetical protein
MHALAGHMSSAMLERCRHIRTAAKWEGVEVLSHTREPATVVYTESASSNGVPQKSPQWADLRCFSNL